MPEPIVPAFLCKKKLKENAGTHSSGVFINSTNQNNDQRNTKPASSSFSSSTSPKPSLPPDVLVEIKNQLMDMVEHLCVLDEKIEWMEYSITDHSYRLNELEAMMNYGNSSDHNEEFSSSSEYDQQNCGWDDQNCDTNYGSSLSHHHNSIPSLMDMSPDASFSALDKASVLAQRHAPLPAHMNLGGSLNDSLALRQEISMVSSTHKNLTSQLDSILEKLDSFSFPNNTSLSK
ncbi:hypothetical protein RhiirA4_430161 [Rhizophagus irregularis]|uniref:Uncharacterized protein n=1 Tax=Rhizophagus irregularis TaxID=588596 RepID=A0A2I1HJM2_9GLOM|nr:hypothetical protein RhiirA4_430161 [Rhizophagus irregularis]